jgi:hypothetical protein
VPRALPRSQPGHLFTMYVKEKLEEVLLRVRQQVMRDARTDLPKALASVQDARYMNTMLDRCISVAQCSTADVCGATRVCSASLIPPIVF